MKKKNPITFYHILTLGVFLLIILIVIDLQVSHFDKRLNDIEDMIWDLEKQIGGLYPKYEPKEVDCSNQFCLNITVSDSHTVGVGGLNIINESYKFITKSLGG